MLRPALAVATQISTFRVCIVNCCTFKYSCSPGRKHSLYFLRLQFWCFTRIFARRRRTLHPCSPSFSHSFALFHTLSLSGFLLSDFWSAIKVLKSMFKCWTKRHNNSMAKTKVAPPIHPPPLRTFPANILGTRPSKRTHSAGPAGLFTFSAGHHFRCKIHNAHCAGILPSYHWHFRQHFVHLWCVPPVIDWGLHLIRV